MYLPQDPVMLLSVINTKLRDCYSSFTALCEEEDVSEREITDRLAQIGYRYDSRQNKFM